MDYGRIAKIAAGVAGLSFLGYCIYFDRKRRSDPLFKQKLKERRERARRNASNSKKKLNIPDLKDQNAIQQFFLASVEEGERYLAMQDYENCVNSLTQAIAVCGQPQQLLQVFRTTLPPQVFQMLLANLAALGENQPAGASGMNVASGMSVGAPMGVPEVKTTDETDVLD
ncbi:mitochondrial import receptor subunit TOM20 homolog [Clytia hemisphaerica]|uniref:Mitochondrial import receptor subunit TOM20 n=1 Tax=Clytia hemisphaerica TaxID=252671 RepID=A0A7M5V567_9CNID